MVCVGSKHTLKPLWTEERTDLVHRRSYSVVIHPEAVIWVLHAHTQGGLRLTLLRVLDQSLSPSVKAQHIWELAALGIPCSSQYRRIRTHTSQEMCRLSGNQLSCNLIYLLLPRMLSGPLLFPSPCTGFHCTLGDSTEQWL